MMRVVVIGAGIGGLTTAAALAKSGFDVTVLEAHIYAGGCAGTFFHQGYRFDAGATLAAGFYQGGPMDLVAQKTGIKSWPAHPVEAVMASHLPDGNQITRWAGEKRHAARIAAFGSQSDSFWHWQESTADALWDFALRLPDWPLQTIHQALTTTMTGIRWLGQDFSRWKPNFLADFFRPASVHLTNTDERLRLFIDGQLLIAAQSTSNYTNALYAASALDLPRRGAVHLEGGMGAIAETLVGAIRKHGGKVHFRKRVTEILTENRRIIGVKLQRGEIYPADIVIANLTPWNVSRLLGSAAPPRLRNLPKQPGDGWGAFTLYLGLDEKQLTPDLPLHHQVIQREPLGEGNSIFLSISPGWDSSRAPHGRRAVTISTHTNFSTWWELAEHDPDGYQSRTQQFTERLLDLAEIALPRIRSGADLILPGTPLTFQRYTSRAWGWVGGFPMTSLFRAWGPRLAPGLWMVGDSIFPGQSTAAVALGGIRVAVDVKRSLMGAKQPQSGAEYAVS